MPACRARRLARHASAIGSAAKINMDNRSQTSPYPERRNARLPDYNYAGLGAYFITVCTQGKECFFGEICGNQVAVNEYGRLVEGEWGRIPSVWPVVKLDAFIVMPNHIHGILVIEDLDTEKAGAVTPLPGRASRSGAASAAPPGSPLQGEAELAGSVGANQSARSSGTAVSPP